MTLNPNYTGAIISTYTLSHIFLIGNYCYHYWQKKFSYNDTRQTLINTFKNQLQVCSTNCQLVRTYRKGNLTHLSETYQLDVIDLKTRLLPLIAMAITLSAMPIFKAYRGQAQSSLFLRATSGLRFLSVCGFALSAMQGGYLTSGIAAIGGVVIGSAISLFPRQTGQACSFIAQKTSNCFNSLFRRAPI